jgi:uncharacterized protein with HEPN domain
MPHKLSVSLWDMQGVMDEIAEYTAGKTLADYLNNRQLRRSVERCFIILGEALVRVREDFPQAHAEIMHATKAIGFRNHLVHRYDVVDDEEVWKIVEVSLPLMRDVVARMLEANHE